MINHLLQNAHYIYWVVFSPSLHVQLLCWHSMEMLLQLGSFCLHVHSLSQSLFLFNYYETCWISWHHNLNNYENWKKVLLLTRFEPRTSWQQRQFRTDNLDCSTMLPPPPHKLLVWYSGHGLKTYLLPGMRIVKKKNFIIQMFPLFRCSLFRSPL